MNVNAYFLFLNLEVQRCLITALPLYNVQFEPPFVPILILYGGGIAHILCPSVSPAAPCTDQLRTAAPLLPILLLLSPRALQLKSLRIPKSQQA